MQHQATDSDKTVFVGISEGTSPLLPPSVRPVTGNPSAHSHKDMTYIAQQTSLAEYTPGLNPLVNSASRLLLEIVRLRSDEKGYLSANAAPKKETPDSLDHEYNGPASSYSIEALRSRLEAEVRGFEAQALVSEVDHSQVLAARYVLCTAVDEAIGVSSISESGEWSKLALLSTFHNETWGGEKFFNILDRCMQQPARNLYLLELMYLLLSMGFEGKYRVLDRGPIALESLRDRLYRQIRLLRGEPNPDLARKPAHGKREETIYTYIPLWLISFVVLACIIVSFAVFSLVLDKHADPLLEEIHQYKGEGAVGLYSFSWPTDGYRPSERSGIILEKGASSC